MLCRVMATLSSNRSILPKNNIPEPKDFCGERSDKELENVIWD